MKTFWRISNYADLRGEGGRIASARWHTEGKPIVYLAESPAGALLERLVHLVLREHGSVPRTYDLLKIQVPDDLPIMPLEPEAVPEWRTNASVTRRLGDRWLANAETALARVPSVIVPETWNDLLNPAHPDAGKARIVSVIRERFDVRLLRIGGH